MSTSCSGQVWSHCGRTSELVHLIGSLPSSESRANSVPHEEGRREVRPSEREPVPHESSPGRNSSSADTGKRAENGVKSWHSSASLLCRGWIYERKDNLTRSPQQTRTRDFATTGSRV